MPFCHPRHRKNRHRSCPRDSKAISRSIVKSALIISDPWCVLELGYNGITFHSAMLAYICLQDKFLQPNPTKLMIHSLFERREDSASLGAGEIRAAIAPLAKLQSEEQQSFAAAVFLREIDVLQARVTGSEHSSAATYLKMSLARSTFLSSSSLL